MPYENRKQNYKRQLLERLRILVPQIRELEKQVFNPPKITDEWMEEYEKLNLLKVDLMIVKNHLNNIGNKYSGITEVSIDRNLFKNK